MAIKLKVLPRSTIKAKVKPVFPATLQGESGIEVVKEDGVWKIRPDGTLELLAGLDASLGVVTQTSPITFVKRGLEAPAAGFTIANPYGTAGNPTFALSNDLAALEAMPGTGIVVRTASETYAQRTITAPASGITVSNGDGVSGNPTLALANDLAAYEGLSTSGVVVRTGDGTATTRTLTAPAAGVTVSNGDGVSGNPTLALANDLAALEAMSSTGLVARTASETYAQRTLTAPAAGITVSNGNGVSGNPTLVLANDLAALEGLGSTGIAVRSTTDTWVQRAVAGTANEIALTNGDGVSGNPTASLPPALTFTGKTVTGGTFNGIAIGSTSTAATQSPGDNSTKLATTAYVDAAAGGGDFLNVKDYGATGDAKYLANGAITTGTAIFTSATAAFTLADVGKVIRVVGAAAAGATLSTTIAGYTNSTTVTLTNNAGTSVSGATFVFGTNDTTAIQAAITAATSVGALSAAVYLPNGLYITTSALSITQAMRFFGDGKANSFIFPALTTNGFSVNTTGAVTIEQLHIAYISAPSASYGISLDGTGTGNNGSVIRDVMVVNPYIGIATLKAVFYTIENNRIFTPGYCGIQINNTGTPDAGNGLVSGNFIQDLSYTKIGIEFTSGGGTRIVNNYVLNVAVGLRFALLSAAVTGQLIVEGNHFDGCATAGIHVIRQGTTGTFRQLMINDNCLPLCALGVYIPTDATGQWIRGVTINGNTYNDNGTANCAFVYANSTFDISVIGNSSQATVGTSINIWFSATVTTAVSHGNTKTGTWTASVNSAANSSISPTSSANFN